MPTTSAYIQLWLSPDASALQADIKLLHSSGQMSHYETYLTLAISALPKGYPVDEYLSATQWVDGRPYRSGRDDDSGQLLPLGPLLPVVSLVTNLRGWVKSDDVCVRELQINAVAATRLRPQVGEWQLGYNAERKLTIERVTVRENMEAIIDPR